MSVLGRLGAAFNAAITSNTPAPLFRTGQRVEYIAEPNVTPVHIGVVTQVWGKRVKVLFDGFELSTWMEEEALKEVAR